MLKDSDGVFDSIEQHIHSNIPVELDEMEKKDYCESQWIKIYDDIKKWVKWGECVTIEIDTKTNSAIVVSNQ